MLNVPNYIAQEEKEILQFYVRGTTNVIQLESTSVAEKSENGSRSRKKNYRKKLIEDNDTTYTEDASTSSTENFHHSKLKSDNSTTTS